MKKYNLLLALSMLIGILFISCENYEYYEYQSWGWEEQSPYNVSLSDINVASTHTTVSNSANTRNYKKIIFTYPTTNVSGQSIRASAIICIPETLYNSSTKNVSFMILAHHGAMTKNSEAPSESEGADWLPDLIGSKNAIGVEADYIGFGASKSEMQSFAYGDVNAKTSLQALICARMWLRSEGYTLNNTLANIGFSQGGQTAMHAQKLVDKTSYGSLVSITKTFAGGGCYDLKTTVNYSLDNYNPPVLPAVIWLGITTVNRISGSPIDESLIFKNPTQIDELIGKTSATDYSAKNYSLSAYSSSVWSTSLQSAMTTSNSSLRAQINQIVEGMNCNFTPKSTSKIVLFSDSADDVVPTANSDNLYEYFNTHGFPMTSITNEADATFHTDNVYIKYATNGTVKHTSAATAFKEKVVNELQANW